MTPQTQQQPPVMPNGGDFKSGEASGKDSGGDPQMAAIAKKLGQIPGMDEGTLNKAMQVIGKVINEIRAGKPQEPVQAQGDGPTQRGGPEQRGSAQQRGAAGQKSNPTQGGSPTQGGDSAQRGDPAGAGQERAPQASETSAPRGVQAQDLREQLRKGFENAGIESGMIDKIMEALGLA